MGMLYIVWKPEYNTGLSILDEQNRGLVCIINSFFFHKNDAHGDINRFLVPTADMFKNYLKIRYMTLLDLLEKAAYPQLEEFETSELEFMNTIMAKDLSYRKVRDADGFLAFLKDYWLEHAKDQGQVWIDYLQAYYGNSI